MDICKKLDLNPSDAVWLATSLDPTFDKFMRMPDINRLSLCDLFDTSDD